MSYGIDEAVNERHRRILAECYEHYRVVRDYSAIPVWFSWTIDWDLTHYTAQAFTTPVGIPPPTSRKDDILLGPLVIYRTSEIPSGLLGIVTSAGTPIYQKIADHVELSINLHRLLNG